MLSFSAWVPHRAEPETRIWVPAVYLVVIPGNRNEEAGNELNKGTKPNK